MKDNEMKTNEEKNNELNMNELEQVNGGKWIEDLGKLLKTVIKEPAEPAKTGNPNTKNPSTARGKC